MAPADPKRGGERHTLTVDRGVARGIDDEGERIRAGVMASSEWMWGCAHVTPAAGGVDAEVMGDV